MKVFNKIREQDKEYNQIYNLIESKNREEKLKNRIQDSNINFSELLNPMFNKSPSNNIDTKLS